MNAPEAQPDPIEITETLSVAYTYDAPEAKNSVVEVTFTDGTITHNRGVNAVFTDGAYDADATEQRVFEVARGVQHKIAAGVIKNAVIEEIE